MSRYEALGVRRVINAAAAQTKLGGSLMPPPVLAAMNDAASSFVHLPELRDRVGERLAELTHNEAACVSCGAAAGILIAVAACMTRDDLSQVTALPDSSGLRRNEVISFRGQNNGFLLSVTETGATLIEVGADPDELRGAITDRTAAVLWFDGDFWEPEAMPLAPTLEIAHEREVPVIVDAADQIPPLSNLWRFTRDEGADLAIFSGGKGLRGPQSSGLIVGREDLIRACRANSGHQYSISRPAKVGKEELLGLLAAVEWSLALDEPAVKDGYEAILAGWIAGLQDVPGTSVSRTDTSHSGQPIPRALIAFESTERRDEIIDTLWEMDPRVAVLPDGELAIGLNPQLLSTGHPEIVLESVRRAITNEGLPSSV